MKTHVIRDPELAAEWHAKFIDRQPVLLDGKKYLIEEACSAFSPAFESMTCKLSPCVEPTVTALDLSNPPAGATHYLRVDIDHPFRKKVNGVCFSWRGQVLGWKQIEPIAEKWWEPLSTDQVTPTMTCNWPRSPYNGRGLLFHPCTPKPVEPAQWDGEGLPPVGVDCEVLWSSTEAAYVVCKVLAHDEGRAVFRYTTGSRKGEYQSDTQGEYNLLPYFRPIKTMEQLAAEQREAEVRLIAVKVNVVLPVAERIYDAGLRFPEEK